MPNLHQEGVLQSSDSLAWADGGFELRQQPCPHHNQTTDCEQVPTSK